MDASEPIKAINELQQSFKNSEKEQILETLDTMASKYIQNLKSKYTWQFIYKFRKHIQHFYAFYVYTDAQIRQDIQDKDQMFPLKLYMEMLLRYFKKVQELEKQPIISQEKLLQDLSESYNRVMTRYENEVTNGQFKQYMPEIQEQKLSKELKPLQRKQIKLEAKSEQSRQSIAIQEQQMVKLKEDLDHLKEEKERQKQSIDKAHERVAQLEANIANVKQQIKDSQLQNYQRNVALRQLKESLEKMEKAREEYIAEIGEQKLQLQRLSENIIEREKALQILTENVKTIRAANDQLKQQYEAQMVVKRTAEEQIKELDEQKQQLISEMSSVDEQALLVDSSMEQIKRDIGKYEQEKTDIQAQIQKIRLDDLQKQKDALNKVINDVQHNIVQRKEHLKKLQIRETQLRDILTAKKEEYRLLNDKMTRLNAKLERNVIVYNEKNKEIESLLNKVKVFKTIIDTTTKEIKKQMTQNAQVEENNAKEIESLDEKINAVKQQKSDIIKESKRLESQVNIQVSEIEKHKQQNIELQKIQEDLGDQLLVRIQTIAKNKDLLWQKKDEYQSLTKSFNEVNAAIEVLQNQEKEVGALYKKDMKTIRELKDQMREQTQVLDDHGKQNAEILEEINRLTSETQQLQKDLKSMKEKKRELSNEFETGKDVIKETEQEIKDLIDNIATNKRSIELILADIAENRIRLGGLSDNYVQINNLFEKEKEGLQEVMNYLRQQGQQLQKLITQQQTIKGNKPDIDIGIKNEQLQQYLVLKFKFNEKGQYQGYITLKDFPVNSKLSGEQRLSYILQSFIFSIIGKIQIDFENLEDALKRLTNVLQFVPQGIDAKTKQSIADIAESLKQELKSESEKFTQFHFDYNYQFQNLGGIRAQLRPQQNDQGSFLNKAYITIRQNKEEFMNRYFPYMMPNILKTKLPTLQNYDADANQQYMIKLRNAYPSELLTLQKKLDKLLSLFNRGDDETSAKWNLKLLNNFFIDNILFTPDADLANNDFNLPADFKKQLTQLLKAKNLNAFQTQFNTMFKIKEGRTAISRLDLKITNLRDKMYTVVDILDLGNNASQLFNVLKSDSSSIAFSNWLVRKANDYSYFQIKSLNAIETLLTQLQPIINAKHQGVNQYTNTEQNKNVNALPNSRNVGLNLRDEDGESGPNPDIEDEYVQEINHFSNKQTVNEYLTHIFNYLADAI